MSRMNIWMLYIGIRESAKINNIIILVKIAVILLRKARPEVERKFKTPGVPFTPLITVGFCFYLMASLPKVTWIRFGIWLLVGLTIYLMYGFRHSKLQKVA
jgi:APA family basic amino acid/polyamine antiporter